MSTPNPNTPAANQTETQKPVDTRLLEMIEYSLAQTEAEEKAVLSNRPPRLRNILWMHRFQVMTWLMQHGVAIPLHIVMDQSHPRVGEQSVDAPVQAELDVEQKPKSKAKE